MVHGAGEKSDGGGRQIRLILPFPGTPYDPYAAYGDKSLRGAYRSIGINRNDFLAVIQMRPQMEQENGVIEWLAFASNAFNVLVPFYADVEETPEYLSNTTGEVSTENFLLVEPSDRSDGGRFLPELGVPCRALSEVVGDFKTTHGVASFARFALMSSPGLQSSSRIQMPSSMA